MLLTHVLGYRTVYICIAYEMRMGHEETGERWRERESVTLKDCGVSNGCVCVFLSFGCTSRAENSAFAGARICGSKMCLR